MKTPKGHSVRFVGLGNTPRYRARMECRGYMIVLEKFADDRVVAECVDTGERAEFSSWEKARDEALKLFDKWI